MKNGSTVQVLNIEDVYPNPKHYREVKKENVDKIAASIDVAGQLVPIDVVKDGDIYFVLAGHHRLEAMKQLGDKTIQAIVHDFNEMDSAVSMIGTNLSIPESEVEKSRGIQMMFPTGVTPQMAAAVTGESVERVTKAQRALKAAGEAAEDMTLEKLIAIDEFSDDEAAVFTIMNSEDWERDVRILTRDRNRAKATERAAAFISACGIELIDEVDHATMDYGGSENVALVSEIHIPQTAKYAKVVGDPWSAMAQVTWFKEKAEEVVDPEEAERLVREAEHETEIRLARFSMDSKRKQFLRSYLNDEPDKRGDFLHEYLENMWESDPYINTNVHGIMDELKSLVGFITRIYASLISRADREAVRVMDELAEEDTESWAVENEGSGVLHYYAALKSVGYEPTELEASLLATLETVLVDKEDDE